MNPSEAKKIIKDQSKELDHCKRFNTQTVSQEYAWIQANSYLEGYEHGVRIGYEQGRNTNGEKTYENGVNETDENLRIATDTLKWIGNLKCDCPAAENPELTHYCDGRAVYKANEILSLLQQKP